MAAALLRRSLPLPSLPSLAALSTTLRAALLAPPQAPSFKDTLTGALAGLLELLPPIVLAVPKSKISHSRKSMRSANKGLKNKTNFNHCPACGTIKLAHNLCPNCYSQITRRWKKESRP